MITESITMATGKPPEATLLWLRSKNVDVKDAAYTFATIEGAHVKNGSFENVDFRHARFRDCYFRQVTFRRCNFSGAHFDKCDLPHVKFIECQFPYSRWFSTQVELAQILPNLPYAWPNVARDLCNNLRLNAAGLGDGRGARALLFRSMAFHRAMLREQVLQRHSWFKERYGFANRFTASVKLAGSFLERWLWGYGESPWLVLVWGITTIVAFAAYYHGVPLPEYAQSTDSVFAAVKFSALVFVGAVSPTTVSDVSVGALALEGTLGLVFIGLLAAVIFRWISVRQM